MINEILTNSVAERYKNRGHVSAIVMRLGLPQGGVI